MENEEKIIETFKASDVECNYDYEVRKTNITKQRELFAFLPIWINSKFRWLKRVKILERKYYSRRKVFDDGWSYQFYWTRWKEEWRTEQILN
jgi:hypothetical protein